MYCYATVVSQWNLVFNLAGIFSAVLAENLAMIPGRHQESDVGLPQRVVYQRHVGIDIDPERRQNISRARLGRVRWSRFVGQVGGLFKMYSNC